MAARNHQNHLLPVLQWKREFIPWRTLNTQSKDCPQNKLLFLTYMTNSSLGRHMNAVRNSSVLYHKRGPARGWWWRVRFYVARLNFETSRVGVYNCLSLIVGFAVNLQFGRGRLSLVAISFYTLSLLFGLWHLSELTLAGPHKTKKPFEVKICKNRIF